MTPRNLDRPNIESCHGHGSMSFSGHSRTTSCSQTNTCKFSTNLETPKFAVEDTGATPTTMACSAKSVGLDDVVLSSKESGAHVKKHGGKTTKGITRPNAGPGCALLIADSVSANATSNCTPMAAHAPLAPSAALPAPAVAPTVQSTFQAAHPNIDKDWTGLGDAGTPFASAHPTLQSLGNRRAAAGSNVMSELRARIVNPARMLDQHPASAMVNVAEARSII